MKKFTLATFIGYCIGLIIAAGLTWLFIHWTLNLITTVTVKQSIGITILWCLFVGTLKQILKQNKTK
jgi:hypothetical protein